MKHTVLLLLLALALTASAAQEPETVAWRNGAWFVETGFRRVDVYSIGDRLTLKNPSKVDRTVDLTGRFLIGAFGEAHNHNIPSDNTERTIRAYLERGIFYVMIQTNVPEAPAKLKGQINRPASVDVLFSNGTSPSRAATQRHSYRFAGDKVAELTAFVIRTDKARTGDRTTNEAKQMARARQG
jgi:hypothetical protein